MKRLIAIAAIAAVGAVGCATTPTYNGTEIDPTVYCPVSEWTYVLDQSLEGGHWVYTGPNPLCDFVHSSEVGLHAGNPTP
jgi:hypothetical protein